MSVASDKKLCKLIALPSSSYYVSNVLVELFKYFNSILIHF